MVSTLLIVDDEAAIRDELTESLSKEGFDCLSANSGKEGINILRSNPDVSIILTDLQMPNHGGFEMIKAARSDQSEERQLEVIVITGHCTTEQAIRASDLGVLEFIPKPFDVDHILEVVRHAENQLQKRG
ncbi:MAG: response regulator [Alphaproteobacteria bacterium]|nr:response regulator [Alphaproteobacteria bacterium]